MDGISAAASIWSLCEATSALLKYFNTTRHAPEDMRNFEKELISLQTVLISLVKLKYDLTKSTVAQVDGWTNTVRALKDNDGAFAECTMTMVQLQKKIHSKGSKRLIAMWAFIKQDVVDMLLRIERLKATITMSIGFDQLNISNETHSQVLELGAQAKRELSKNRVQNALNWISQLSFRSQQAHHISIIQQDTVKWFLESEKYSHWLEEPKQILYCPGMPGAGKTILAASVIRHIEEEVLEPTVAAKSLAYIYCDYQSKHEQSVCQLLGSLLQQITQKNHDLAEPLVILYENHAENKTLPSADELTSTLKIVISQQADVYIVIDAIDECPQEDKKRSHLLRTLLDLHVDLEPLHLLLTSRDTPDITTLVGTAPCLEVKAQTEDVRLYVRSRFVDYGAALNDEWKTNIEKVIVTRTNGMFLVARILSDHFASLHRVRDVKALYNNLLKEEDLPMTVADMYSSLYDDTMERINKQGAADKELAQKAIMWVSNAARVLKIQELRCALAVEAGDEDFDEDGLYLTHTIISVCAGLLVVDQQSQTVRLVHYTAQEYFLKRRYQNASEKLASTCLTYLCFRQFGTSGQPHARESKPYDIQEAYMKWHGIVYSNGEGGAWSYHSTEIGEVHIPNQADERVDQLSLLNYAAEFWAFHAQNCQVQVTELAVRLLCDQHLAANAFIHAGSLYKPWPSLRLDTDELTSRATGLHLIAALGLGHICDKLLDTIRLKWVLDIDIKDDGRRTPLMWAAHHGHLHIMKTLIATTSGRYHQTRWESRIVHPFCRRDSQGQTVLHYAARSGHAAVVQYLLEFDIERDAESQWGSLLSWSENQRSSKHNWATGSSKAGYHENEDFDIESRARAESILGQTPIVLAALGGHGDVVQLLSQWDKRSLHHEVMLGLFPIHLAAQRSSVAVYRLLTEDHNIDAHVLDPKGYHPFVVAADWNNEHIVRYCLAVPDLIGPTEKRHANIMQAAIITASNWKRFEVLKLILVEAGSMLSDTELAMLITAAVDAGNMNAAIFIAAMQAKRHLKGGGRLMAY